MDSKELAIVIAKALNSKKAQDIKIIKIRDLTVITDFFVIATGTSSTQVKALAEEVEFQVETNQNMQPLRKEGYDTRNWIVLDYANVVVHVFNSETRSQYDLERLWADGEMIDVNLD